MLKGYTFMRWSKQGVPVVKKIRPEAVLVGLAWSFSATLAACAVMCAWVVLSAGPVYSFSAFVTAGTLLGATLGGVACGRTAGTLGALHGLMVGLAYGLLLSALLFIGSEKSFSASGLVFRTVVLGVVGSAGGIIGVNLYSKVRSIRGKRTTKQPGL